MSEEVSGELSFFDKLKIKFSGAKGGKIIFIIVVSLLYLWHVYFVLHVPFMPSTLSYILCFLLFAFLWYFGCSDLSGFDK